MNALKTTQIIELTTLLIILAQFVKWAVII